MSDFHLLLENLFENDLEGMIKNVLSIDDFESKIDKQVMVIAFYVTNEEAAEDLAIFLERSRITNILDTEVSLTPNKDGQYIVFVEIDIKNTTISDTYKCICDILQIVTILSGKMKWRIKNNRILQNKLYPHNEHNTKVLLHKITEWNRRKNQED